MTKLKAPKIIPFEFVLEALEGLSPITKPMFGAYAVYIKDKIVFILRDRPTAIEDNGVWLATSVEFHSSLQNEFPSMRSIGIFGEGPSAWQVLPKESFDFEESVMRAVELVISKDQRIGKVPKKKLTKRSSSVK